MNRHQKLLKKFHKDVAIWINKGCPDEVGFFKNLALCSQARTWFNNLPFYKRFFYDRTEFLHGLAEIFKYDTFPFGYAEYATEHLEGDHYKNKDRLAFIFEQAGIKQESK